MEETSQKDINYPRIVPRSLTAGCCAKNKGALDWSVFFYSCYVFIVLKIFSIRSSTGLLAYGSNYSVVVVDTIHLQVIQTLDKHKTSVVKVHFNNYNVKLSYQFLFYFTYLTLGKVARENTIRNCCPNFFS